MKKILFLVSVSLLVFASCKNGEAKTEVETSTEDAAVLKEKTMPEQVFKGEFIYIADGAILKVGNTIYSVAIDEMTEQLAKKVAPVKKEDYDMVEVVIKGDVSKKPEGQEGWDSIITIKEIVSVSDQPAQADIRIEEKKN